MRCRPTKSRSTSWSVSWPACRARSPACRPGLAIRHLARAVRGGTAAVDGVRLAGHFDISIGLTRMLIAAQEDGQPGRDHVSFFIFPRAEVAPTVYDYAYTMVEGEVALRHACRARGDVLEDDLGIEGAPTRHGRFGLLRADAARRVRGQQDRRGRRARDGSHRRPRARLIATSEGLAYTAELLDDLLERTHCRGSSSRPERRRRVGLCRLRTRCAS